MPLSRFIQLIHLQLKATQLLERWSTFFRGTEGAGVRHFQQSRLVLLSEVIDAQIHHYRMR